jgi:hypothetical protein
MAGRDQMRRETTGGLLLALSLAACGPNWQPSWNMSSQPAIPGDGLTVSRVTGGDPPFEVLRSQDINQVRLSVGNLLNTRPAVPEVPPAEMREVSPTPRAEVPRPAPRGSSTPPVDASVPPRANPPQARAVPPPAETEEQRRRRRESEVVTIPGQPPAVVTGSTGRVQSLAQPGNPAGGVAIRDGGTTTIIQPGGRVTTVPTPR